MLSIFSGPNFLEFNAMELFASLAILTGGIWTYYRWRKNKKRKLSLITFPNNWVAQRNLGRDEFHLQATVEIWLPHTTIGYLAKVFSMDGKQINVNFSRPQRSMNPNRSEVWIIDGTAPLSLFPDHLRTIEVSIEVVLDGGEVKKKSKKRIVSITDEGVAPSIPDKEGSQTQ